MKINYITGAVDFYGGFVVTNHVVNGLVERGHEVTLVLRHRQPLRFDWKADVRFAERPLDTIKRRASSLVTRVLGQKSLSLYAALDSMTPAIPDADISIVQSALYVYPAFRSGKGAPFHYVLHFEKLVYEVESPQAVPLVHESMFLPIHRVANSQWCANQLRQHYGLDMPVVNPAIDHDIFYPRERSENRRKRLMCMCKHVEWKGFRDAIEAVKLVMARRGDVEFVIFGADPKFYGIDVPHTYVGKVSKNELAQLYCSCDVLLCPSWYESFPLPPIEAMACGTPVVTTRYGTEDYAADGENALVVMPRDPKAMADAILRLLENESLSERFRQAGPQTAKRFTWDKTVDQLERIFTRTLAV
jgi:glycosyltransferase involved in cell wall biosynthesis